LKTFNDKIYKKLTQNETRDKVLKGLLIEDDCDHPEVLNFLKLLKQKQPTEYRYQQVTTDEWRTVVHKAKKQSLSSVFSKKNYSLYKYSIQSELITELLVKYYNAIIIKEFYSLRWLKTLNIILEKGKGPVLGKLRMIQLIEADFQLIMRIFLKLRNKGKIEKDQHLSKFNIGSK